ncbi:hypothetical protein CEXT_186821 [Caerostris extrusa]|uniref:Uncharacterized protein n=1 Tax=Caerostris extrusa TaxID=172846 RepID=A0AAV4X6W0_CAEEX|nr:hypothetical protein CEXT_186821 [Caerostris extrusa]
MTVSFNPSIAVSQKSRKIPLSSQTDSPPSRFPSIPDRDRLCAYSPLLPFSVQPLAIMRVVDRLRVRIQCARFLSYELVENTCWESMRSS